MTIKTKAIVLTVGILLGAIVVPSIIYLFDLPNWAMIVAGGILGVAIGIVNGVKTA